MAKLYDLKAIAEGDELAAIAFENNPNLRYITCENAEMAIKDNETRVVGIRFPVKLLEWIDGYSRILAVDQKKRVTRNMVIINFLEQMKLLIEDREKTEGSHIDEIEKLIALARSQQEAQS